MFGVGSFVVPAAALGLEALGGREFSGFLIGKGDTAESVIGN